MEGSCFQTNDALCVSVYPRKPSRNKCSSEGEEKLELYGLLRTVIINNYSPSRVGDEMLDSHYTRFVGYRHFISNKCEWNDCFIKNNHEILLNRADFAL